MKSRSVEWKEAWHDEHLRTICAFANASGGVLEVGRRDDGAVVGVSGVKLLSANPRMTVKAISAELGINERNIKKNIKALKDAGRIDRVGSHRNSYWVVKDTQE